MKLVLQRPLIDIFICLLWSLILILLDLIGMEGMIRLLLGLPVVLFIPGYLLSYSLFPLQTTGMKIDTIQRIALSFAFSLGIIPIIGFFLNQTPLGLQNTQILISLHLVIVILGLVALFRWHQTPRDKRVITTINLFFPKLEKNLDSLLTVILVVMIIITSITVTYALFSPNAEKPFTEFYLLNKEGLAADYHRNLVIAENSSVIIGIANHEYKPIAYTIEIWLMNQTIRYNNVTKNNETIYYMWYIDKLSVLLEHTDADLSKPWKPQWEYNYTFNISKETFNISKKGDFRDFKLLFLLYNYTKTTENYHSNKIYINRTPGEITNANATTNLMLNVSKRPKIYEVKATPETTLTGNFVNISCMVFDADGIKKVLLKIYYPHKLKEDEHIDITNNRTGLKYYCNRTYSLVGNYIFSITAIDNTPDNNTSRSLDYGFSVTDIPQIIELNSSVYKGGFVNITCRINDMDGLEAVSLNISDPYGTVENISIINNITISIVNVTINNRTVSKTVFKYYYNNSYSIEGTYDYYIWTKDVRGNTNISDTKKFFIANTLY